MPVEIWWYIQGRVLYSPGSARIEDIAERNARALELIETQGQPPLVHTIIDHTNRYTPDELRAQPASIHYYMNVDKNEVREKLLSHPLMGWVLSVQPPNAAFKMSATVVAQQSNYHWRSFDTLEAALDFFQDMDPSLSPLPCS